VPAARRRFAMPERAVTRESIMLSSRRVQLMA